MAGIAQDFLSVWLWRSSSCQIVTISATEDLCRNSGGAIPAGCHWRNYIAIESPIAPG
ncbi:hypothetical protein [Trichothermofontia sp.]